MNKKKINILIIALSIILASSLFGFKFYNNNMISKKESIAATQKLEQQKETYDSGVKLMADKKYRDAIDQFQKITNDNGTLYDETQKKIEECDNGIMLQTLKNASIYLDKEKFDEGLKCVEGVLKIDPTNKDALELKNTLTSRKEASLEASLNVSKYNFATKSILYISGVTTENTQILDYKISDVNSDGNTENIVLAGYYDAINGLEKAKLLIFDTQKNLIQSIDTAVMNEDGNKLDFADFNKDGASDIVITEQPQGIHNGLSVEVVSFKDNKFEFLLNSNAKSVNKNKDMNIDYNYNRGNIKVHVNSLNRDYNITVKKEYNSKILESIKQYENNSDTYVRSPYTKLIKLNENDYGLLYVYPIHNSILSEASELGFINFTFKWSVEKSDWEIVNCEVNNELPRNLTY